MAASTTPKTAEAVAVAFSGGLDSTALLVATARQGHPLGLRVVALHVHHGLMPEAEAWVSHAQKVCAQLQVPLCVARVKGRPAKGDSVEAWARRQRYAALAEMAKAEGASLVLLAQHADDQAETVLLQALRGAGPAGLAAMPPQWEAEGLRWARPWLRQPRAALQALVAQAGLTVVNDPSNADPRFARSRLRLEVLPLLRAAFPQASAVLGEVARHAAQAKRLAAEVAQLDLPGCTDAQGRLRYTPLSQLPPARRRNALAAWLVAQLGDTPVALLDRLEQEWQGQGAQWPCPAGLLRSSRRLLSLEASPSAK